MTQTTNNGWQQAIYQNTKALGGLEAKVNDLKDDVKEIKSKISNIETEVSQLKTDVSQLKTDMSEVKGLLQWLKWLAGGVITIALALVANFLSTLII